jgi:hypothetical protein
VFLFVSLLVAGTRRLDEIAEVAVFAGPTHDRVYEASHGGAGCLSGRSQALSLAVGRGPRRSSSLLGPGRTLFGLVGLSAIDDGEVRVVSAYTVPVSEAAPGRGN